MEMSLAHQGRIERDIGKLQDEIKMLEDLPTEVALEAARFVAEKSGIDMDDLEGMVDQVVDAVSDAIYDMEQYHEKQISKLEGELACQ